MVKFDFINIKKNNNIVEKHPVENRTEDFKAMVAMHEHVIRIATLVILLGYLFWSTKKLFWIVKYQGFGYFHLDPTNINILFTGFYLHAVFLVKIALKYLYGNK